MTGKSIPHPHALGSCTSHGSGAGEEIVHSWRKRRESVNPLVVGSNPTGPIFLPTRGLPLESTALHKTRKIPRAARPAKKPYKLFDERDLFMLVPSAGGHL
jgi:hypothetical protein